MKTVVVTGGAGFVGSHLCERLLGMGMMVVALDDLSTGSRSNVDHLLPNARFRFVLQDVTAPFEIAADWIFHLACPASPVHYQRNPIKTVVTNVLGTLNTLNLSARTGARMLLSSTSEVYGDPEVHPQPESYRGSVSCIGPRACYDEGKRCAETLCFDHHRAAGVDVCVARIFNTYGPRMAAEDGRVVSNFIVQALRGQDLTLYGSGQQTRSFCYVDDLVSGLIALMESSEVGPVNLGNPAEFTMEELAREVLAATGSNSRIVHCELPVDDPRQRRPDISLAKRVLGFAPRVALRDGLRPTVEHFRGSLGRTAGSSTTRPASKRANGRSSARAVSAGSSNRL
jgi:UDP-glucuronate decarboxylase